MQIRLWRPDDGCALAVLIKQCLTETYAAGADFQPTDDNVSRLLDVGLKWSHDCEPTLLAHSDADVVLGYVLWGPAAPTLATREKVCIGIGTYVLPAHRRHHIATALRAEASRVARARGYTRVQGAVYDAPGRRSCLAAGFTLMPVQQVELRL